MRDRESKSVTLIAFNAAVVGAALAMLVVSSYAAKPPEKIREIECSIFEALPILEEVRPFLDDAEAPEQADFKTRLAYVDDWTKRRAMAAVRLDKLIEVCRTKLAESTESGD